MEEEVIYVLSGDMGPKDWVLIILGVLNTLTLIATIYVINKSPSDAVKIGRELNEAKQKDDAKRDLFYELFSYRGSPVHYHFVDALNRIDIIFADVPKVLAAWHKYYDSLHQNNQTDPDTEWRHSRNDLLSIISQHLGYKDLKQYDFEKHYYPKGHEWQQKNQEVFYQEQLNYYKNHNKVLTKMLNNSPDQSSEKITEDDNDQ